jgi:hypothetical protein
MMDADIAMLTASSSRQVARRLEIDTFTLIGSTVHRYGDGAGVAEQTCWPS